MSYHHYYGNHLNWRSSRRKKHSRVPALTSLVIAVIISAFLAFIFPALAPGVSFWTWPGLSYYALFQQSLPGMGFDVLGPEARPHSGGPLSTVPLSFEEYPHYLINQELPGLKMLDKEGHKDISRDGHFEDVPVMERGVPPYAPTDPEPEPLGLHPPSDPMETPSYVHSRTDQSRYTPAISGDAPRVLIYHTHTTESFVPETGKAFSENMEKTVVVLGEDLADILEQTYGIPVLHHTEIFDIPRREGYANALPRIQEILEENPQVEVVLDLHRDGVPRTVTTLDINGKLTGRLLFVVGTRHEKWDQNLRFALFLQQLIEDRYPGLSRGVRKQNYIYNQHLHQRSIIVEIGGHENDLMEVRNTIPYLAEIIAEAFS